MRKRNSLAVIGCAVAGILLLSGCSSKVTAEVPDVIQVQNVEDSGEGTISLSSSETVEVVPDMAEVVFGITTEDKNAGTCQQKNTEQLNQLLEYLKGQGFEENSIKTSGFSLEPRYDWSRNERQLVGYEMTTSVTVTDVPIDTVGTVLTNGVANGANEIDSVSYFSSQYDEAYKEALAKAVELAKGKAEALAEASGRTLGGVKTIEEYSDSQYGRYVSAKFSSRATDAVAEEAGGMMDMGVMPGEMQVTARINIVFELVSQ